MTSVDNIMSAIVTTCQYYRPFFPLDGIGLNLIVKRQYVLPVLVFVNQVVLASSCQRSFDVGSKSMSHLLGWEAGMRRDIVFFATPVILIRGSVGDRHRALSAGSVVFNLDTLRCQGSLRLLDSLTQSNCRSWKFSGIVGILSKLIKEICGGDPGEVGVIMKKGFEGSRGNRVRKD
ncbi:MAG: hypothetical protein GQ565_01930 [Candidatus Aegiribacteria sp.]|nr:hypothetical protein [Candidatus Aegiribacteria sp.]